ncbi:major facilitator superfamily domain-containing protein 1-like [Macrosteles quadrilineatus]|uniref:major facilitator superfamily domain-containing protein 1-like n=1 Tax=Macrosteles quadrilineatus TaxID=74068 RepID=UPI0023E2524A|nr:major facilitator superfamily domain-containing protein 1-like [Macrosteles quadrilineatus]
MDEITDVEDTESSLKQDNSGPMRFFALFLMCLLGFGSYFCYDNPGAIQNKFTEDMGLSTAEFTLLYSVYSWPNVVLCFVGGFLIDRVFGVRLGTVLYAFIVVIGQLVFAYGAYANSFALMLVGRFIFGIGGESLAVAQNNYAVVWFMGKELNTVFGLQLSFARVGSTVNLWVLKYMYEAVQQYFHGYQCLGITLFLAAATCVMSLLGAVILGMLRNRREESARDNASTDVVRITDVKDFNLTFWLITVICVAYYVAIFPLIALGTVFFERKYDMTEDDASHANSILYITSAAFSPVSGYIVDKTGRNVFWVSLSIFCTILAHGMLAFTFVNPYIVMGIIGLAYSMLAGSLWPLVAYIIPQYQLGTAYGVAQAIQNLGLGVITLVTGIIVDSGGYFMLELFFLAWLAVALVTGIVIWLYDAKHSGILNMSTTQREEMDRLRQAAELAEREKLLSANASDASQDLLTPQSDFQIRNRYLSRIGANLPSHLAPFKGMAYRTLR